MKRTSGLLAVAALAGMTGLTLGQAANSIPGTPPALTADKLAEQAAKDPASNLGTKLEQLGSQPADPKTADEVRETLAQLLNDGLGHRTIPLRVDVGRRALQRR